MKAAVIERKPKKAARSFGSRTLLSFALLALICAPLFSQQAGRQPNESRPSLQDVAAALAKNKVARGQFVLERSAANGRVLKSSGAFTIAADYGIIWKTEKPVKSVQAVAKDFIITESAAGKRAKLDGSQNKVYLQMALLTSALWTGDLAAVQAAAAANFRSDENSWTLELLPKDAAVQMALEKIVVAGTWSPSAAQSLPKAAATLMEMRLKGGNSARYLMSGHEYDSALTSAELSYFN